MRFDYAQYCRCPRCLSRLTQLEDALECQGCGAKHALMDGIATLLPEYADQARLDYVECYEEIARNDLVTPIEQAREARHTELMAFVGGLRGRRVLDIGSSHGLYLTESQADFKVAFDIALPYLQAIPDRADVGRVRGDAERLPFRKGFFDVVLISDVLEHVLDAHQVMEGLARVSTPDTRVFVHVPWKENLAMYSDGKYRFSHVRTFDDYTFADITKRFKVVRTRDSIPNLEMPIHFRIAARMPRLVANHLTGRYFSEPGLADRELAWRRQVISELPRRQWWLLRLYPPVFRMFELRLRRDQELPEVVDDEPRHIAVLVPHIPEDDPRVGWVTETCARLAATRVLAYTPLLINPLRLRSEHVATDRICNMEVPKRDIALLNWRVRLLNSGPIVRFQARSGSAPTRTKNVVSWLAARIDHELGAALRVAAIWAYNHVVSDALYRRLRSMPVKPRVVVCHEVHTLRAAVRARRRREISSRICYDSHEWTPENDLLAPPWERRLVEWRERRLVRHADAIATVSPPLALYMARKWRVKPVIPVPNAPSLEPGIEPSCARSVGSPVRFLVQGIVAPHRGFEELLTAWRLVPAGTAVLLLRCPPWQYLDELRSRYADLLADGRVEILPPVPPTELVRAATVADVGVIPYGGKSINHMYACPNKLGQYLQAGLAILSNDLQFIREVVEEHDCGRVCRFEDPAAVAATVADLAQDVRSLQRMKENARVAAETAYNWAVVSRPYEEALKSLLEAPSW